MKYGKSLLGKPLELSILRNGQEVAGVHAENIIKNKIQGSADAVVYLNAGEKLDYFNIGTRKIAAVSGRARYKPALSATKQAQCLKFRLNVFRIARLCNSTPSNPTTIILSLVLRKTVFGVSDQVPHKPGCAGTEDG